MLSASHHQGGERSAHQCGKPLLLALDLFGELLPLLLYGAVSTMESGTTGFWRLALTGHIQWMMVNFCDLLFLDFWLIQRKAKSRFITPGTEGHPGYGFNAWMKDYALPEHLAPVAVLMCSYHGGGPGRAGAASSTCFGELGDKKDVPHRYLFSNRQIGSQDDGMPLGKNCGRWAIRMSDAWIPQEAFGPTIAGRQMIPVSSRSLSAGASRNRRMSFVKVGASWKTRCLSHAGAESMPASTARRSYDPKGAGTRKEKKLPSDSS